MPSMKVAVALTLLWLWLGFFVGVKLHDGINAGVMIPFNVILVCFLICFFLVFCVCCIRSTLPVVSIYVFESLLGIVFILFFSNLYKENTGSFLVPEASDAILYHRSAVELILGQLKIHEYIESYGIADFGAVFYVFMVYFFFGASPIFVYMVNFILSLHLSSLLRVKGESRLYRAVRISLPLNPIIFYLTVSSLKDLLLYYILVSFVLSFLARKFISCGLLLVLVIAFRPALIALFFLSIMILLVCYNLKSLFLRLRLRRDWVFGLPMILGFFLGFPFLLDFLESGLFSTIEYFASREVFIKYGIFTTFLLSFFTSFFGPLLSISTGDGFSMQAFYAFSIPLVIFLNARFFFLAIPRFSQFSYRVRVIVTFSVLSLLSIFLMLRGFDARYTIAFYIINWWILERHTAALEFRCLKRLV